MPTTRDRSDPVFSGGALPRHSVLASQKIQGRLVCDANVRGFGSSKAEIPQKRALSIYGHPNAHLSGNVNRSANDGTVTRFGWKAQNKSLLIFASEAYNVEMGVTNQLFQQERDETPGCIFNATPEDTLNFTPPAASGSSNTAVLSDIEAFANFMRMLAPPIPAPPTPSSKKGRAAF